VSIEKLIENHLNPVGSQAMHPIPTETEYPE
jgi:hypothetical protein